jgi:hypothetical protein
MFIHVFLPVAIAVSGLDFFAKEFAVRVVLASGIGGVVKYTSSAEAFSSSYTSSKSTSAIARKTSDGCDDLYWDRG